MARMRAFGSSKLEMRQIDHTQNVGGKGGSGAGRKGQGRYIERLYLRPAFRLPVEHFVLVSCNCKLADRLGEDAG